MNLRPLASRIQHFRRQFKELAATEFSDRYLVRLNRQVELDYAKRTRSLLDIRSLASLADQRQYTLAADVLLVQDIIYQPTVAHRTLRAVDAETMARVQYATGSPTVYSVNGASKALLLHSTPSTSAQTTTLNGALTAVATSVTVVSTSGFGSRGRIQVDEEIIGYTAATSTTLTGLTRGMEGTYAVSHSSGATVTWQDLELTCVVAPRLMERVYTTGTVTVTIDSTTITGASSLWNTGRNILPGNFFGVGSYETTPTASTFPYYWYEVESITSDTVAVLVDSYRQVTASAQSYFISDVSSFSEDIGIVMVNGMLALALWQVRSPEWKTMRKLYEQAVGDGRQTLFPPDYVPRQRPRGTVSVGPQIDDADYPGVHW